MGKKFSNMEWSWSWTEVCRVVESYKTKLTSVMVKWEKPEENTWKLNTDGSYMINQGKAGAGGIVRNRNGQMIMAFAAPVEFLTNNYSETQAALQGLIWCCQQNFQHLTIELDSFFVVNMILSKCNTPWKLQDDIAQIREKTHLHNIKVKHCLREGNTVADFLSKYATTLTTKVTFMNEKDLPTEVRGAIRMDRMKMPSFKIRAKKHSTWIFEPP